MEKIKNSMQKLKNSINNMPEQNQLSSVNMNAKSNTKLSTGKALAAIVFSVCLCLIVPSINSAQASTTVSERVDFSRAMPEENVEDMSVKVLGGSISVNRFYRVMKRNPDEAGYPGVSGDLQGYNGNTLQSEAFLFEAGKAKRSDFAVWQFHRRWHDLLFVETRVASATTSGGSSSDGSTTGSGPSSGDSSLLDAPKPRLIDRNDYLYQLKDGEDYYVYEHNGNDLRITITDTGFRWSNRQGDWIDYDKEGLATRSGNKNGVSINLVRENGFITQYKDHFGNTVVTWEYLNGKPIKATDYDGRVVEYKWQGHDLIEVTTTRGHKWKYGYNQIGLNRVMSSKTDPENQTFLYEFQETEGGFQYSTPGSGGPDVTLIGDDTPVATSPGGSNSGSSSGSSNQIGFSIPVEPTLMHTAMIYPDGKRVRYQYRYDPQSESYMILEVNSDGVERERWYDLDGQVRYHLVGGRVAGVRVRNGQNASSRDAYGNRTITEYNRFEAIESITYADGGTVKYEYLPNYNFATLIIDQLKFKTKHEYDTKGNRIKTILGFESSNVREIEYKYDQYGQLTLTRYIGRTNQDGSVSQSVEVKNEYDDYGNLVKQTDGNGAILEYKSFDSRGNYQSFIDGRKFSTEYSYDQNGNFTSQTTSLGYKSVSVFDSLHRRIEYRDAERRVTRVRYDSRNNLTRSIDNLGNEKINRYRIDNQLVETIDESGQATNLKYDRLGRIIESVDGTGNTTNLVYQKHEELAGSNIAYSKGPNTETHYNYDALNRETIVANKDVKAGDLLSATQNSYTLRGNLRVTKDPNGNLTTYAYNAHNEIAFATDAEGSTIRYYYDNRGNLIRLIDALGYSTVYEYDGNNNKISESRPFVGDAEILKQSYFYDENNNLTRKTDYKGNVAIYSFDADDRMIMRKDIFASEPIKNGSKAERVINYGYDKSNALMSYSDSIVSVDYKRDGLGRVEEQTTKYFLETIDGSSSGQSVVSKTIKTGYYPNSQIRYKVDAEGNRTSYIYDKASKLLIQNAGTVVVNSYEGNLPSALSFPGGVTRQLEYDGLGRYSRIHVTDNARNTSLDFEYEYDSEGNVIKLNKRYSSQNTNEFTYAYDDVNRIISATQPNAFGDQEFTYDKNGNRLTQTKILEGLTTLSSYGYNSYQELSSIEHENGGNTNSRQLSYDVNGAVLSGSQEGLVYSHNSYNRVARVFREADSSVLAKYYYDHEGRRTIKHTPNDTTLFLYDDLDASLVAEYQGDGDLIRGYGYYLNDSFTTDPLVLKTTVSDSLDNVQFSYYQNDHIGTPVQLISGIGQIVWQADYDVFGDTIENIKEIDQPLRLPGQYSDSENQTYYNWNRYYDPRTGRYITSDPIGLAGGFNLFSYVDSRPLNFIDDEGLFKKKFIKKLGEILSKRCRGNKKCMEWKCVALNAYMHSICDRTDTETRCKGTDSCGNLLWKRQNHQFCVRLRKMVKACHDKMGRKKDPKKKGHQESIDTKRQAIAKCDRFLKEGKCCP
jgi:RHS repeat-associated protein